MSAAPVKRRPPSRPGSRRAAVVASLALAVVLVPALVAGAAVDDTGVASLATDGSPAGGASGPGVAVSGDGRFVVFESSADNLSDADNDAVVNIYARDRQTGETQLVSRANGPAGVAADADSTSPAISSSGTALVAFESRATNLSDFDGDAVSDVFVRDLEAGTTALVSIAGGGSPADGDSGDPSVSGNGNVIAFESQATNLSDFDADEHMDVFILNRQSGALQLVSRPASGAPADGPSFDPSISANGRRVGFASDADNLFLDDRDIYTNVYVALIEPAFTLLTHASRTPATGSEHHPANGSSSQPAISADGAQVAFTSTATNLAGGVGLPQVFVRDISANDTRLVSRAGGPLGAMAAAAASSPSISADGRLIAFSTAAGNLGEPGAAADEQRQPPIAGSDVFVRDMAWDDTILMSRQSGAAGAPMERDSAGPALSPGGTLLAFVSDVKVGEDPPAGEGGQPTDILRSTVFARELGWRAPPVYVPPPDGNGHGGHGDTGHTTGHADAGHAAAGHDAGTAHGHGAGGAHFTLKQGSPAADRMFGTPLHDKLCGGGGNDLISLGGGPDVGYGGQCGALSPPVTDARSWWRTSFDEGEAPRGVDGNDTLKGRAGDDALYAAAGDDRLLGGSGNDYLSGGSGGDRLVGGPGRNRFDAGAGKDSINSANGVRELVDCGFGRDTVKADRRDVLSGCERVQRVRRARKKDPVQLLPECPGGGHACHENESGTVVLSGVRRGG